MLSACDRPPEASVAARHCVPGGELVVSVYGGLEGKIDWQGGELACEGMPRPHGKGARLRFEGPAARAGTDADRLAFIIALPDLVRGQKATELAASVTLMEVDEGRFFISPEQAGCWADVDGHESIDGGNNEYRISGLVYCVSPLAEVNGTTSVSLRDLRFTGRLDWTQPE